MSRGAATPLLDLAGRWLGSFQLVRLLGTGAMGAVYLAKDTVLRRDVAMKLIAKGESDNDTDRHERFLREARAAARLIHPNVVQIFQVGEDERFRFIAMEYVEGVTTAQAAKQQGGRLPEQLGIEKMREAADALRLAESLGICHRDIKPANLLLTGAGILKIADFGLAAQVEGGESIGPGSASQLEGTPFYMSPEQWSGGPISAKADIYSLGCTFYHLLVGVTPFAARDLVGCFRAHSMSPVPDPKVLTPEMDPLLADLLRRCMSKRPAERPTAIQIVEVLDDMLMLRRSAVRSRAPLGPAIPPAPTPTPPPARPAPRDPVTDAPTQRVAMAGAGTLQSAGRQASTTTREAIAAFRQIGTFGQQTYHEFFALTGYPFSDIRQPTSFWDAGPYATAVRTLAAQILAGQRPAMLLGAPGSGRTFVCEMVRGKFPQIFTFPIEPQLLFGTRVMVALCRQFGAATISPSASQRFLVEAFLAQVLPRDRPDAVAVVVVDGVDPEDQEILLELDDILRNAPGRKLSMVLIGTEDLPARLVTMHAPPGLLAGPPPVTLRSMTPQEMIDYVEFRMKSIGGSARGLELDIASQQLLHARSGGSPKLVNVFCHNALTIAALKQEREIPLSTLRLGMKSKNYLSPEAARDLLLK
jgi:serine/threonine protein kinase/type II secretory pathway predicted ATPase ExeA